MVVLTFDPTACRDQTDIVQHWRDMAITSPCSTLITCGGALRGLVIHDIKEVEGVRQQEEREDKRDEEEGDEVNGEVEEITHRAHET